MNKAEALVAPWQKVSDQLYRHFEMSPHQCLLWVDPAQSDPFEGHPIVEQMRLRTPIRHPRFDPFRAPYVVPLDLSRSADAALFRDSVELAWLSWGVEHLSAMRGQPICGWVRTSMPAKVLAGHWGWHCHLHTRQGKSKLLRFQDPGVREWLWHDLSETQQRAMLGPAGSVHAIGRGQSLIQHSWTNGATLPSAHSPSQYPDLLLNHAQWDRVEDYAIVHAAWLSWRNSPGRDAAQSNQPGWERPILGALTQATHLGLRDPPDRELFALHALQLGAEFHRHPQLQEVWRQTQAGEFYGSAIEEVTGRDADQLYAFIHGSKGYRNEGIHG
jgi:hypothetical protein